MKMKTTQKSTMKSKKSKKKKKDTNSGQKYMTLVETTIVKPDNELFPILDNLCFLSKNVYNSAVYQYRQSYIFDKKKLSYPIINNMFVKENNSDYYALPPKVSQQSIKLAVAEFTSYFGNLRSKKKNKNDRVVHFPGYLNSITGRQTVFYTNQAISTVNLKTDGYYTLSKVTDDRGNLIKFKTSVTDIQFVRISHKGNHIRIEVGYKVPKVRYKVTENIAAIDLGVNNLVTLTTNFDSPIIFNGKPLKYINHNYNQLIAKNQSSNIKCNNLVNDKGDPIWTTHMNKIALVRKCKIEDYLHKISRTIVNYLVSNHITLLIIGKNDGWKQNTNMRSINNQNFVQIPFNKLISMLIYKCDTVGIKVETVCESHTSKCSFLDNEPIQHHDKYMGKRVTRDLFKTANNKVINADVNGSYNIMKRWCISNNCTHYLKFNKYLVYLNPIKITLKLNGKKCNIGEYIN